MLFSRDKRIELDDANSWFYKLIEFVANKYETDRDLIMSIINQYKQEGLKSSPVDLIKLAFKLKSEDKSEDNRKKQNNYIKTEYNNLSPFGMMNKLVWAKKIRENYLAEHLYYIKELD